MRTVYILLIMWAIVNIGLIVFVGLSFIAAEVQARHRRRHVARRRDARKGYLPIFDEEWHP